MGDPLDEILHDKHRISSDLLAALRPEDLERARSTAMERGNSNRVRAISLLVAARAAGTDRVLATILQDRDEAASIRAVAASQLGRLGPIGEEERVLGGALLEVSDPTIRIQIAGALGRIGTPNSLDALSRLVEGSDGALKQQADFARSVIAYRHGIHGYELPVPDLRETLPLDSNRAQPFTLSPAPLREALVALVSIGSETYGLHLKPELSFVIQCRPARMLLALNPEGLGRDGSPVVISRPLLLGLIADRSPEDGSYSVRWLLLSWPGDKKPRVNLAVHRPSGPQIMSGALIMGSSGGDFELRSMRRPGGIPVLLRGRLDGQRVEVTEALSEQTATTRRFPTPTQPPRRESPQY